jgi:excinuclease ABC subunit C
VKFVTPEEYQSEIKMALQFLKGRDKKVLKELSLKMKEASEAEQFELAAKIRDGIEAMKAVLEKQIVVNDSVDIDQDIIGICGDERGSIIETLHIRAGRVVGTRSHFIAHLNVSSPSEDPRDWMTDFLNQYYEENVVPDEVILPLPIGGDLTKLLEDVLKERKSSKVRVHFGTDRNTQKLLDMVDNNVKMHFKSHLEKSDKKLVGL